MRQEGCGSIRYKQSGSDKTKDLDVAWWNPCNVSLAGKGRSEAKMKWLWTELELRRPAVMAIFEVNNSIDEIRTFRKEARSFHYDAKFLWQEKGVSASRTA